MGNSLLHYERLGFKPQHCQAATVWIIGPLILYSVSWLTLQRNNFTYFGQYTFQCVVLYIVQNKQKTKELCGGLQKTLMAAEVFCWCLRVLTLSGLSNHKMYSPIKHCLIVEGKSYSPQDLNWHTSLWVMWFYTFLWIKFRIFVMNFVTWMNMYLNYLALISRKWASAVLKVLFLYSVSLQIIKRSSVKCINGVRTWETLCALLVWSYQIYG